MNSFIRRTGLVVLVAVLLIGSTAPALAQQSSSNWSDQFYQELKPLVGQYNENVDQVPSLITGVIGGERVEFVVEPTDGGQNAVYSAVVAKNGHIQSFENEAPQKPTIRVTTSEATLKTIMNATDKQKAFSEAYNNGAFTYKTFNMWSQVKLGAASMGLKVVNAFHSVF